MKRFWSKPPFLIVVAILLVAIVGVAYDTSIETPTVVDVDDVEGDASKPAQWMPAPDFAFTDLDGSAHHLSDFKGKVVLLNFWATWCTPCVAEFPQLINLVHSFDGHVILLALSSDKTEAAIQKFVSQQDETTRKWSRDKSVHIAHDDHQKITRDLFLTQIYPETIIISPDMKMAHKIIGVTDWESDKLKKKIALLLDPALQVGDRK